MDVGKMAEFWEKGPKTGPTRVGREFQIFSKIFFGNQKMDIFFVHFSKRPILPAEKISRHCILKN